MSEDQCDEKCQSEGSGSFGNAGANPLQRLMSEHEAACQQEAHFSPTDPQLLRLMSQAERDMQAAWQQEFAPRVPDVTGEGCADRSAPGAVGDIYIRSHAERSVAWPDPPAEVLSDPLFEAIWQAIKSWDVNVPGAYGGYCGATGNHVYAIYRAMAAVAPPQPDFRAERDNLLEMAIDQATQINALEAEKAALIAKDNLRHEFNISLADKNISKDTKIAALEAQLAAFTAADPQPAVPDPPSRRPDGTPAPQPRPWNPPKPGGDPRRIGG